MSEESLSVSELNRYIKDVINAGFPQALWICGEIQNYDRNKGKKHIFFELVEKEEGSQDIKARIGLVIFGGTRTYIDNILAKSENAFELKDDIEVKFLCKVDFYAPHGAVRLVVESIDPVYTLGKLAQEKQKLIALLKEKGVLDKNKQLPLPSVPLRIGLITADDSAAYNDFRSELKKSNYGFKVCLRNTLMQGAKAQDDICCAIRELNDLTTIDCIVITRGGGSLADLSCFDSQKIAEAIAASALPVLSGIGHEINLTITDLAAHTYAKTPTAIAQFLVERIRLYIELITEKGRYILEASQRTLESAKRRLKGSAVDLQSFTTQYFKDHIEKIIRFSQILSSRPQVIIRDRQKGIADIREELKRGIELRFSNEQFKLKGYRKIVDIVHPHNTMKRGFSITRTKEGKLVRKLADVHVDEQLKIEVTDGIIEGQVKDKKGFRV